MPTNSDHTDSEIESERERLKYIATQQNDLKGQLQELNRTLRKKSGKSKDPEYLDLYLQSLNLLSIDELTHFDLVAVARTHGLKTIPHADSFWRSIVLRRRKKQLGVVPEKRLGLNKQKDEQFAHDVGISTVRTHYRGTFSNIPRNISPAVLKPVVSSGSRGAFYLFEDGIFSIASTRPIENWEELTALAKKETGRSSLDDLDWELQDLVTLNGRPAPDLKFYSFYGEIGAILEVTRHPDVQYAYFDGALSPINFRTDEKPSFDDLSTASVLNNGLDSKKLDIVRKISLEIPVPFMRIDFLNSDDDLIFCEFSSAPGMSHSLTEQHDARLGTLYNQAELRLVDDLLAGKHFETFMNYAGRSHRANIS